MRKVLLSTKVVAYGNELRNNGKFQTLNSKSGRGRLREVVAYKGFQISEGGVLPYKGLMGTCGQPGYVFRDFCLKQGIEFIIFVLIRVSVYQFLS